MTLWERIEQINQDDEQEVIWEDMPETPGQKWFREEAERRRQELINERESNVKP